MVVSLVLGIGLCWFSFCFGKDWHHFHKPLQRFKRFLKRKINEAEELCKNDLPDVNTKHLDNNPDNPLDRSEIEPFRQLYAKWRAFVYSGIVNALNKETKANIGVIFAAPQMTQSAILFGEYRKYLREDIGFLRKIKMEVKSDWLDEKFIPENLEEYEL